MHELSLCERIAAIVENAREGRGVTAVHLRVGHLRQVVPDTLVYCWDLVTADTPLAGAELRVEHVPVTLTCTDCGADTTPSELSFVCGSCASTTVTVTGGEEFLLTSVDLT